MERDHVRRVLSFAVIGGFVAGVGAVQMVLYVQGLGIEKNLAFALQTFCSLQLNFVLNNLFTWKGRTGSTLKAKWVKYHITRLGGVVFNQLLFGLLTLAIPYGVAYVVCILVTAALNFFTSEKLVFTSQKK